jgi:ABC-type nitrate/sulfonate/bicarbonate transport system permease component
MRTDSQLSHRTAARWIIGSISIVLILAAWEAIIDLGHVSERVMASPSSTLREMINQWPTLWSATALTAGEGLAGFAIAIPLGIGVGILFYLLWPVSAALSPLVTILQTVPMITIAPLFIIWFGFEPGGKIVLVAIFSFFPIVIQTNRGLHSVPRYFEDVALTCGAGRAWTLFHVKLRVAARHIVGGMRIAAVYVFGTAVTAEYLGARNGLGIVLQGAFNSFRTPLIVAATILVVALTGILVGIVSLIERIWFADDTADFSRM